MTQVQALSARFDQEGVVVPDEPSAQRPDEAEGDGGKDQRFEPEAAPAEPETASAETTASEETPVAEAAVEGDATPEESSEAVAPDKGEKG